MEELETYHKAYIFLLDYYKYLDENKQKEIKEHLEKLGLYENGKDD